MTFYEQLIFACSILFNTQPTQPEKQTQSPLRKTDSFHRYASQKKSRVQVVEAITPSSLDDSDNEDEFKKYFEHVHQPHLKSAMKNYYPGSSRNNTKKSVRFTLENKQL